MGDDCRAVSRQLDPTVAHYLLLLLVVSSGLFTSATSLLPSSFAMYTLTMAAAALLDGQLCRQVHWF